MDADYPPLPHSGESRAFSQPLSLRELADSSLSPCLGTTNDAQVELYPCTHLQVAVTAILEHGDVILEYISPDHLSESAKPYIYRWQVSSEALAQNSPYFKALLDPNKFSEGRLFMKQKTEHRGTATDIDDDASNHPHPDSDGESVWKDLPTVRLPSGHISPKLGVDAIGTFLRILSFGSFDEEKQRIFDLEIKFQRPSLVARVVQLADAFNSPHVVREALQRSAYVYGRKHSFLKFDDSMLKLAEDRIRQSIFIARFLDDRTVFQILTHTLIILGSKSWIMGLEQLISPPAFPWWYLPDGLEEEIYYRRQCILNTITDLQAYFLRAFGALEEPETEPATPKGPGRAITSSRPYQCRCGYGNSSACDMFHLGQMTRFFALRTKTIFLGSSLIDPEFDLEILSDGVGNVSDRAQAQAQTQSVGNGELPPSTDITAVIASLRQCPDYQIDTNHTGCGVRRRFIPPLDCIEGLVGDRRGLVGIALKHWDAKKWPLASGSWANASLRRALVIDVHFSKISAVPRMSPGRSLSGSQEENARLLFTAKKRSWEA